MRKGGAVILAVVAALCAVFGWYYYGPVAPPPETLDVTGWQEAEELPASSQVSLFTRIRNFPAGTKKITGVWVNDTSVMLTIGATFELHKYVDGKWLVAERSDGRGAYFELWAREVYPGGSNTVDYDLTCYVDEATPGRYRISAEASEYGKWWRKHPVYVEFNIR